MKKYVIIGTIILLGILGCKNQVKIQEDVKSSQSSQEKKREVFTISNVSASEAKEIIATENITIIDIRTLDEYDRGHIEDAVNIDFYNKDFKEELDFLDKRNGYLIYCRTGNRSRHAMDVVKEIGMEKVYHLNNGIVEWVDMGYELNK